MRPYAKERGITKRCAPTRRSPLYDRFSGPLSQEKASSAYRHHQKIVKKMKSGTPMFCFMVIESREEVNRTGINSRSRKKEM
jgi:hypothetical protein